VISKAKEADILRLFHAEKWKVNTIATQLGVHHSTVQRVLAHAGFVQPFDWRGAASARYSLPSARWRT
jgi:IS30 family transposase